MPKLSEAFLSILGNALQGDEGTPAAQEMRSIRLAQNAREEAQNRWANAENSRRNLSTLASLNQNFNVHQPGFVGPMNQGSLAPSATDLQSLGVAPGTTYEPVQQSVLQATPNFKTGRMDMQNIPLQRGQQFKETNPYAGILMGQQKNYLDQANHFETNANNALNQMTTLMGHEDPSITGPILSSIAQGILPQDIASRLKTPGIADQVQNLFGIYKQNKDQASQWRTQGANVLGGGTPAPAMNPGGGATSGATPPMLGTVKIQSSDGKIWNIPSANVQAAKLRDPNLQVLQ